VTNFIILETNKLVSKNNFSCSDKTLVEWISNTIDVVELIIIREGPIRSR